MSEDVVCLDFRCLPVVSITKAASDPPFGDALTEVELGPGPDRGTAKDEVIEYLTCSRLQQVSTSYAAAPYGVDKPCIFTIDGEGYARHAAW